MSSGVWKLFWKEYRTQRSAWLAITAGMLIVQLIALMVHLFNPHARLALIDILPITLVFATCYAGACAAILFAGESEEQTDQLLRQLPISYGQLATGKLLFAAVSILLLAATGGVSSLAVAGIGKMSFQVGWAGELNYFASLGGNLLLLAMVTLGVFVNVLLFSLLSSNVLLSVSAGAALSVATVGLYRGIVSDWPLPLMLGSSALLITIELFLLRRWQQGRAQPLLSRTHDWTQSTWPATSRFWGQGLRWASAGSPESLRETSVLGWVELRSAIKTGILFSILLGVLEAFRLFGNRQPTIGVLMLVSCSAVVCGVLAYASNQRQRTMGFLADRGASPGRIWGVKLIVWLGLALLVARGGMWLDQQIISMLRRISVQIPRSGYMELAELMRLAIPSELRMRIPLLSPDIRTTLTLLVICLFSLGQLLGLVIRRNLLSFFVALVAGTVFVAASSGLLSLGVSPWWFLFPLAAAYLLGSRILVSGWLTGQQGWRRAIHKCCWLGVPVLLLAILIPRWRVREIPEFSPGFDWQQRAALFERPSPLSEDWKAMVGTLRLLSREAHGEAALAARGEQSEFVMEKLRTIAAQLPGHRDEFVDPLLTIDASDIGLPTYVLGKAVQRSVSRQLAEDSLEDAWRDLQAGLDCTQSLARSTVSTMTLRGIVESRARIFESLIAWAQHPGQTREQLAQAAIFFSKPARRTLPVDEQIKNEYVFLRQMTGQQGVLWETLRERNPTFSFASRFPFSYFWRAEAERSVRQFTMLTSSQLTGSPQMDASMEAYIRYLPLGEPFHSDQLPFGERMKQADATMLHGAMLCIALERSRLEQETYPQSLADLVPTYLTELPRDPHNGADFQYFPLGLPHPVAVNSQYTLAPEQPLLYSVGRHGLALRFQPRFDARKLAEPAIALKSGREIVEALNRQFPEGIFLLSENRSVRFTRYMLPGQPIPHMKQIHFVGDTVY